jgi:hypothetical protein
VPPNPSKQVNVATFAIPDHSGGLVVSVQDVQATDENGTPKTDVPTTQLLDLKTRAIWMAVSKFQGFEPLTGQSEATTWAGQPARKFEARITESDGRKYHVLVTGTLRAGQYWMMFIEIEDQQYTAQIDRVRVALDTFQFM